MYKLDMSTKISNVFLKFHGYHILLFLLILVISFGCNKSSKEKEDVIIRNGYLIHPVSPENSEELSLDKIYDIKFIPLEASENSLLSEIEEIERDTTDGFWYILDRNSPNVLFVFSDEGRFIKNIKHIGFGPGEYQTISDFYLSDGSWIEVYDSEQQKLLRYDLKNDDLISERKIPFYAYKYTYLDNGDYVFYKNSQARNLEDEKYFYQLLVLDSDFNLVRTALPFRLKTGINISIMNPNSLTHTPNGVIYNEFNADTLYTVNTDTIKIDHILNYGDYAVPEPNENEFTSGRDKLNYYFSKAGQYVIGVHQIKESEEFFSFNYIYNNQAFMYIYNKTDTTYKNVNTLKFSDKEIFFPPPVYYIDRDFVSIYTLPMLNEKVSISALNKDNIDENAIAQGIENQNPVLVTYRIEVD